MSGRHSLVRGENVTVSGFNNNFITAKFGLLHRENSPEDFPCTWLIIICKLSKCVSDNQGACHPNHIWKCRYVPNQAPIVFLVARANNSPGGSLQSLVRFELAEQVFSTLAGCSSFLLKPQ